MICLMYKMHIGFCLSLPHLCESSATLVVEDLVLGYMLQMAIRSLM